MRGILIAVSIALVSLSPSIAQTPALETEAKLLALVKEVETQQAQIVANQDKIESKLAEVAEAIRVARIYGKRER